MSNPNPRARLSIDVEPEMRRKIKIIATEKDISVRDYVITILQHAIEEEERHGTITEGAAWAGLSARAFIRDWISEEDRVYDDLS